MSVPFKSKDAKITSKQKSLQVLNDQLILAKSENNTTQIRLISIIIKRIKGLED